jgi:aminomethyltransferase
MKITPFTEKHIALGAKMHEFAGYNMPIEYSGIFDEHTTVRTGVGVFDVSHMGEFWVKGPNALPFLQKITTNNVAALPIGKAQYSCFPNGKGGIVDDLLVYHYEPEKYMLVVNAAILKKTGTGVLLTTPKVLNWKMLLIKCSTCCSGTKSN